MSSPVIVVRTRLEQLMDAAAKARACVALIVVVALAAALPMPITYMGQG